MVCSKPFQPCFKSYEHYYHNQAGRGLNYFVGVPHQRGRGWLSSIGRAIIPLLKTGGKALLKEGMNTGAKLAHDVLTGDNIKTAVKKRTREAGKRLFHQAVGHLAGRGATPTVAAPPGQPARKRIKTRVIPSRRQSQSKLAPKKKNKNKKPTFQDIFA